MKIRMKPTKTNLTRTKKRPKASGFFLTPSELKACLSGLEGGDFKTLSPSLVGRAVRFCVSLLEEKCPGESVEVRVVPFAACKVLQGSKPDPHNLMPPDFFEMDPEIFLKLSFGLKNWDEVEEVLNLSPFSRAKELKAFFPLLTPEK